MFILGWRDLPYIPTTTTTDSVQILRTTHRGCGCHIWSAPKLLSDIVAPQRQHPLVVDSIEEVPTRMMVQFRAHLELEIVFGQLIFHDSSISQAFFEIPQSFI